MINISLSNQVMGNVMELFRKEKRQLKQLKNIEYKIRTDGNAETIFQCMRCDKNTKNSIMQRVLINISISVTERRILSVKNVLDIFLINSF